MKKTLMNLVMLLPVLGFAQGNGGITNENASTKIEWIGITNGNYVVKVTNKQSCAVDMNVQWGGTSRFRTKNIAAGSSDTFWIDPPPPARCFLGAKPQTICTGHDDRGTVELNTCAILPVHFTNISGQRVGPHSIKLIFSAEEDGNTDHYNIQYSLDGKTFKTVNVLFPDGVVGGKQYSVIVNY